MKTDLASVTGVAVDVERRQQTHQLFLVTAPARRPAAQSHSRSQTHSGVSKCSYSLQQCTWHFPEVHLFGIRLEIKKMWKHTFKYFIDPLWDTWRYLSMFLKRWMFESNNVVRLMLAQMQHRPLGGSSSPVRTALAEGSARSRAVRPSVFLMVGSAPCCSSASHTHTH